MTVCTADPAAVKLRHGWFPDKQPAVTCQSTICKSHAQALPTPVVWHAVGLRISASGSAQPLREKLSTDMWSVSWRADPHLGPTVKFLLCVTILAGLTLSKISTDE